MTTLVHAAAAARAERLALVRAVPRPDGSLLLALLTPAGDEVAGRWADGRLRVHRDGDDPALPAVAALVADGGRLVAHRSGRRAVVRHADGTRWTKVVPARRAPALAAGLRRASGWPGVDVPPVLACDPAAGTVTLGTLPGVPLHDLLPRLSALPTARAVAVGERVGTAVARLHAAPVADLPTHDLAAEIDVTRGWLARAAALAGLHLPADLPDDGGGGHVPTSPVVLHRDLHDRQLLVDDAPGRPAGHGVGVLDLDLLAAGEAALDLANLLVHLELRVRQGLLSERLLDPLTDAVLSAYAPDPGVRRGLALHARLARLRLAAVHAFRPADADAAVLLTTHPLLEDLA